MNILISPSILAADFTKLREEIEETEKAGADFLHLDIMDGVFVSNLTFGPPIVEAIRRMTRLSLEAHLMIIEPYKYIDDFSKAGADTIIFHIESNSHPLRTIDRIRKNKKKAGLALNPDTPPEKIFPFLSYLDIVLVMTVSPGFCGQRLKEEALSKIPIFVKKRKEMGLNFYIEVDGGIKPKISKKLKKLGADILVSASYFFSPGGKKEKIQALKNK